MYFRAGQRDNGGLPEVYVRKSPAMRLIAESWRTIQRLVDLGHGYAIVPD
jgi:hypothetical protein